MGQTPSFVSQTERELRWRIIQNRHEVKVAIIGERNSGKSSLINTIYRVLSQDPYGFVAEKGNFNSMKQTTNYYREHKLPANITVFDSVGANYSKQGTLQPLVKQTHKRTNKHTQASPSSFYLPLTE
jgi:predicted GTPase